MNQEEIKIEMTSNDDYILKMPKAYSLVRTETKKENEIVNGLKNSILLTDIGVHSKGFSYIAILATIIAIGAFITMYISWRI